MKKRVADLIADFLADNGVTQVFSVVGGGAMHLNNAFGINDRLNVLYNHHEQGSAIAAEGYARVNNKIAAVCVTSGPGGTNALTGVLCAWQDSIPLLVISGQVRCDITVESTGLNLRQFGEQEYYITRSVEPMTKFAVMVSDAKLIKYYLGKALHLAQHGRKGPVWIDVPLDVQGQTIETDNLVEFVPESDEADGAFSLETAKQIVVELKNALRPVIVAGSSIRTSGTLTALHTLTDKLGIPVLCPTSTVDVFSPDRPNYFGMFGTIGSRTGNFIIQNADLILSLGTRLSFKQIGFNYQNFAVNAKKIVVDADAEELKKPTTKIDFPIHADVRDVIFALNSADTSGISDNKSKWLEYCNFLKSKKFPENERTDKKSISAYTFGEALFNKLDENAIAVLGNNCAAVSLLQGGIKKQGQRLFGNVNCGTMGYDLPAALGAAVASGKEIYCLTGDGTFQMNIQELQTIVHNQLSVKIVIFNNNAYQAIAQTHTNFFGGVFAGCTPESGVSFPSFEKIAYAYGFPFKSIDNPAEVESTIDWLIDIDGKAILELVQTEFEPITPKLSSKKLDDGSIVSPPIDDLFPFLSKEEYESCQFENFEEAGK
jgi:acetolactate synthase-1/2/3 large subunit